MKLIDLIDDDGKSWVISVDSICFSRPATVEGYSEYTEIIFKKDQSYEASIYIKIDAAKFASLMATFGG